MLVTDPKPRHKKLTPEPGRRPVGAWAMSEGQVDMDYLVTYSYRMGHLTETGFLGETGNPEREPEQYNRHAVHV